MARLENLLGAQSLALADRLAAGAGTSLPPSAAAALASLLALPDQGVGWLAGVLGLTDSGCTRLVDRLVAADLVQRRPGADARSRRLRLTERGTRQARVLLDHRDAALGSCLEPLTSTERDTLERLLDKVVAGLAEDLDSALRVCRVCDRDRCTDKQQSCPLGHTSPVADPLERTRAET